MIDKQKAMRRDCNIEKRIYKYGFLTSDLHLLSYFDTHRSYSPTGSFYALRINLLK